MTKEEILRKIKRYLKIAALSTAAGYSIPALTRFSDSQQSENSDNNVEKKIQLKPHPISTPSPITPYQPTYKFADLPQLPAVKSLDNPYINYVIDAEEWRQYGKINLKRVDSRYLTTDDLTTVMIQREGDGNAVNVNSSRTRVLICQADVTIAKNFLRFLYCSNRPPLRKFAERYIKKTPNNASLYANIQQLLYNEDGTFKIGTDGIKDRIKAIAKMNNFAVIGINTGNRFTNNFIQDLQNLDNKEHDLLLKAEKEFSVGFYPLANPKNIPARKAATYAQHNNLRDASCVPVGIAGLYLASSIAGGAYSNMTLTREKKTMSNARNASRTDYITKECAYQMALAGYNGADKLYQQFEKAIAADHKKLQLQNKCINLVVTPDISLPTDAIHSYQPKDFEFKNLIQQKTHNNDR